MYNERNNTMLSLSQQSYLFCTLIIYYMYLFVNTVKCKENDGKCRNMWYNSDVTHTKRYEYTCINYRRKAIIIVLKLQKMHIHIREGYNEEHC